jgi:AcrR family transcriptional regulator
MRRRAYHHGNLAQALVQAAGATLEADGLEAVTLRGAAATAGVSPAAPYRHFANKQALLAAVAVHGFEQLAHAVQQARAAAGEPWAALERAGVAWVRFAGDHPSVYQLMFRAVAEQAAGSPLLVAAQAAPRAVLEALTACQKAGALHADAGASSVARTACALLHGLACLRTQGLLSGDLDEATRTALEQLRHGVTS